MTWRVLATLIASLLLLGASAAPPARAQAARLEASEASVKAAFLLKFPAYIEWPPNVFASADAPFVFGVVGDDEIATELEHLASGRQVSGHSIVVKRVQGDNPRGLQVLLVGRGIADRLPAVIRAAQLPGLLVVTENDKGLAAGAAINFVVQDDRVGFEVSPEAAEKNGLRISSRMLAVAKRVAQR
jgi:hypothetical protein